MFAEYMRPLMHSETCFYFFNIIVIWIWTQYQLFPQATSPDRYDWENSQRVRVL